MSVGAATLLLCDEKTAFELSDNPVQITACCGGTHTSARRTGGTWRSCCCPTKRRTRTRTSAQRSAPTGRASARSWRRGWRRTWRITMAGIEDPVEDFDLLETHDAFTISDIQTYEDIGLRPYGQGRDFVESGDCYMDGRLPTNPSGGLIGTMHAVGATGIFQLVENLWQVQNKYDQFHEPAERWTRYGKEKPADWKSLQVPNVKRACAISHAGTGSHVTCTIMERT
jgi:acetyl-CoA C-acetyltransferase